MSPVSALEELTMISSFLSCKDPEITTEKQETASSSSTSSPIPSPPSTVPKTFSTSPNSSFVPIRNANFQDKHIMPSHDNNDDDAHPSNSQTLNSQSSPLQQQQRVPPPGLFSDEISVIKGFLAFKDPEQKIKSHDNNDDDAHPSNSQTHNSRSSPLQQQQQRVPPPGLLSDEISVIKGFLTFKDPEQKIKRRSPLTICQSVAITKSKGSKNSLISSSSSSSNQKQQQTPPQQQQPCPPLLRSIKTEEATSGTISKIYKNQKPFCYTALDELKTLTGFLTFRDPEVVVPNAMQLMMNSYQKPALSFVSISDQLTTTSSLTAPPSLYYKRKSSREMDHKNRAAAATRDCRPCEHDGDDEQRESHHHLQPLPVPRNVSVTLDDSFDRDNEVYTMLGFFSCEHPDRDDGPIVDPLDPINCITSYQRYFEDRLMQDQQQQDDESFVQITNLMVASNDAAAAARKKHGMHASPHSSRRRNGQPQQEVRARKEQHERHQQMKARRRVTWKKKVFNQCLEYNDDLL